MATQEPGSPALPGGFNEHAWGSLRGTGLWVPSIGPWGGGAPSPPDGPSLWQGPQRTTLLNSPLCIKERECASSQPQQTTFDFRVPPVPHSVGCLLGVPTRPSSAEFSQMNHMPARSCTPCSRNLSLYSKHLATARDRRSLWEPQTADALFLRTRCSTHSAPVLTGFGIPV